MSSTITVPEQVPEVEVNVVPFRIHHTGPGNTNAFFTPSKAEEKVGERVDHTAQFRGLKLVGEEVPLGQKKGFVLSSAELLAPAPEEESGFVTVNQYVAQALFEKLRIYGHDALAPLTSQWKLAAEWDAVAEAIHS